MRVFYILIAAGAFACVAAQELKPEDVLDGASASARSYLTDTTELPLNVAVTTTEFDAGGKQRGTRRDNHRFSITQARPQEYKGRGNFGMGTMLFHHGSVSDQLVADMMAVASGMLLRADIRQRFNWEISRPGELPSFRVSYRSAPSCANFEVKDRHLALDHWCGAGEYTVDPAGYALQRFTFEAAGAPVIEGKQLRSYRVEESFQTITVAGSAKPFVVPKTVTVTYEKDKDKGKTVLTCDFSLLPAGSK